MHVTPATARISSQALRNNLNKIKQKAPNSKVIAVVKANAYGHGVEFVSSAIEEIVDCFGVARLAEALRLRSHGITKPILLLEGFFDDKDLAVIAVNNIQTVIHNEEQLNALKNADLPNKMKVWLKIDTGMHRLGVSLEEVDKFYNALSQMPQVKEIGFMSHFSRADEREANFTALQIERFLTAVKDRGERSIAASAGILFWENAHLEWIRPGIIMYGISPNNDINSTRDLTPVMSLVSSLIAVRSIKQGEPVGYGGAWIAERDTHIGIVAIGYGDGYPRDMPFGTPVYINGRYVPVVGRVAMDMLSVDLGENAQDQVGDEVELWGEHLPIEEIASKSGMLTYELITKLTPRVLTEYVD